MKKTILFLLAITCVASTAFAAYQSIENGASIGSTSTTTIKGSKGVQAIYNADTTTSGQGYTIGVYHSSGTQTYATSSGDTKIYKQDVTGATPTTTVPTGSNTADFSGWTSM
jgi:uncharacterized protein YxeA